jgi:glucose/arabinose dehydrogenase
VHETIRIGITTFAFAMLVAATSFAQTADVRDDWHRDAPGTRRLITPTDIPQPRSGSSATNIPSTIPRPDRGELSVPEGFSVALFMSGLKSPRTMRFAPNGDLFVADSQAGVIRILHMGADPAKPESSSVFAAGLQMPFGIAFWPSGPNPRYLYVGTWGAIVRFPYSRGEMTAQGPAEAVISSLPTEGHWTRDIVFSRDGLHMFTSVGSLTNHGEAVNGHDTMQRLTLDQIQDVEGRDGRGAAWGAEQDRATVLESDPDGRNITHYANGLRNCVSLVATPGGDGLWCTVNERDQLGDDLPPDFVTHLVPHGFYGWPWFYIGAHQDPLHLNERPDLAGLVIVPDVLFQAHSAPLTMTFYDGLQFPTPYRGSIFVAMHGSYNRAVRTGSKVVRVMMKDGAPTGEYEDFLTGFTTGDTSVWGRPAGVTVTPEGALLVSDDANGTIWRITYSRPGKE